MDEQKSKIIKNSDCFCKYKDLLEYCLNESMIGSIFRTFKSSENNDIDKNKLDSLIEYILKNINKKELMMQNTQYLENLFYSDQKIEFREPEDNLSQSGILKKKPFYNRKLKNGFVTDGIVTYKSNGNAGEYPYTIENASFIINVLEDFSTRWEKTITISSLLFDGKVIANKEELINLACNPDIPYDFYKEIDNKISNLTEQINLQDEYKKSLEKAKKVFRRLTRSYSR